MPEAIVVPKQQGIGARMLPSLIDMLLYAKFQEALAGRKLEQAQTAQRAFKTEPVGYTYTGKEVSYPAQAVSLRPFLQPTPQAGPTLLGSPSPFVNPLQFSGLPRPEFTLPPAAIPTVQPYTREQLEGWSTAGRERAAMGMPPTTPETEAARERNVEYEGATTLNLYNSQTGESAVAIQKRGQTSKDILANYPGFNVLPTKQAFSAVNPGQVMKQFSDPQAISKAEQWLSTINLSQPAGDFSLLAEAQRLQSVAEQQTPKAGRPVTVQTPQGPQVVQTFTTSTGQVTTKPIGPAPPSATGQYTVTSAIDDNARYWTDIEGQINKPYVGQLGAMQIRTLKGEEKRLYYAKIDAVNYFRRNDPGRIKAGKTPASEWTLPATITKASQAVKYLKVNYGASDNEARNWLLLHIGQ